jgi:hypothetical protein
VAYDEAVFARYGGSGSGAVTGRAFTVFRDSSQRAATNTVLALMPVTDYTTEITERFYARREKLEAADPRITRYVRRAQSDEAGNFAFHNLPPGDYYVSCDVRWWEQTYGTDSSGNVTPTDVAFDQWIYAKVSVRNGQTATVENWNQGPAG